MTFPELHWADKQSLIREERGCETREKLTVKSSRGARSRFPIHGCPTVSVSHFTGTVTSARWEKLMTDGGILPTSMQTPDQLDLKFDDTDSYLPHHQVIRRTSMC